MIWTAAETVLQFDALRQICVVRFKQSKQYIVLLKSVDKKRQAAFDRIDFMNG